MLFLHILKSLDELLYELMTWLFFYPVTLWRAVRHPLRTMGYARSELKKDTDEQFRETLRPPIFLLVTLVIAHVVEVGVVGDSDLVGSHEGLADYINDDTTLIVFRIIAFALFPVVMATIETALSKQPVNRTTLQEPFYAQCFLAGPFALALSLASTAVRATEGWSENAAILFALGASIFYIWTEIRWLERSTPADGPRALACAIGGFVGCMLILAALASALGGE
jgi:nitrate reductase NapE component